MKINNLVFLLVIFQILIATTTSMGFYQNQLKGQFTQIPCLHIEEIIKNEKTQYHAFNYCLSSRRFKFSMKDISGNEYQYSSQCISSGQRNHLDKYNQEDFFYGISEDC
ncbi:transmembrane protein, putative (macronuclear) [Tetrahymena thermophila SB210]|uniref:Transmembrane protein, putative n=1 Tax=Tetrahymena thermophila (strain SB210) TaxID=312017 RepID=Q22NN8_TETTS|nr:transmembrane protein, putative [Tetrahymena thermophila SB210]EAR86747.1 transmembrane protein, putative [Tetrahymena thermophila SB210]|eukprot:XP_001006992.1 transmembrane protein, putative [Tetrahymena thermophila SB210]